MSSRPSWSRLDSKGWHSSQDEEPRKARAVSAMTPECPDTGSRAARERFREVVRKVMLMRRASSMMSGHTLIGAEPGVDPRSLTAFALYGHVRKECQIEVTDYSKTNRKARRMSNDTFIDWAKDPAASARHSWVKVRWINVSGISWDVMSTLAVKYSLHPLALEDILSQRGNAASKADYYTKHLFLRILRHTVDNDRDAEDITDLPLSSSPTQQAGNNDRKYKGLASSQVREINGDRSRSSIQEDPYRAATKALRKGGVHVKIQPMFICLLRDGTVISISPDLGIAFTEPIAQRLQELDSVLRMTADASVLVQGIMDLIVDRAMEVVDEYQGRILKLERQVLMNPKLKTVRYLHVISGDLILHKRTLAPIRSLVYRLRRYDMDWSVASLDASQTESTQVRGVQGYLSPTAKTYLADVLDHMEYILGSLDMFENVTENLIDCTFNVASGDMNMAMKRLTVVTVTMLPMTFLTGYFGMNFNVFWAKNTDPPTSDKWFWAIALPVLAAVGVIFLWADLMKLKRHMQTRSVLRNSAKASEF
ncbi:hypothetical protein GLOTRDRAFT_130378 [Gloeophyllum trabeum ATCC 11539]|uniref:Cora-domain-containing protein n=1 Tax=Gloeophyllum trabeum (strain ATCC 11539 / FP-39264 / Madison 617) TaxID=670483 RepID=S7Q3J6_GLOTA|nr:uncharacterized protein GLOTRDRAFT_130378 [Gloeophyllum trabeum ATCC 11539]EPQ53988.1 hypothetical protein GLOTRDRAFT_130378 [Gloeophyllum trabeum ATCC 11539]